MRERRVGRGQGRQWALEGVQAWGGCPGPVPSLLASPASSLVRGLDLETPL